VPQKNLHYLCIFREWYRVKIFNDWLEALFLCGMPPDEARSPPEPARSASDSSNQRKVSHERKTHASKPEAWATRKFKPTSKAAPLAEPRKKSNQLLGDNLLECDNPNSHARNKNEAVGFPPSKYNFIPIPL
jgi:hypothetical protein